jgi:hypothetical protein
MVPTLLVCQKLYGSFQPEQRSAIATVMFTLELTLATRKTLKQIQD